MFIVVALMQGDLLLPHCGIRAGVRGRLRRQVNYVIHCAASIIFNEHVHTLLANNYQVTLSSCHCMSSSGQISATVSGFI